MNHGSPKSHQVPRLQSCPFCGSTAAPRMQDSEEFYGELWEDINAVCFQVVCDASSPNGPGGCGGSGGFFEKPSEAIAAWNRRATGETT